MKKIKFSRLKEKLSHKYSPIIIVIVSFLLVLFGFTRTGNQNEFPRSNYTKFTFKSDPIPSIERGHYVLWGVENGEKYILKRFNYVEGQLVSLNLQPLTELFIEGEFIYDTYEITVERSADRDEKQSGCILLRGNREGDTINFQVADLNLDTLEASFILATPTDGTSNTNELSGIWFTKKIEGENTKPSLNLPHPPSCFDWAGYVIYRENFLRIGNFKNPNSTDDFSEYSEFTRNPLKVPGEDYLKNVPLNFIPPYNFSQEGNSVILALEPSPSFMSLFLDKRPFWEIMKYDFNGNEISDTPYNLQLVNQPSFQVSVEYVQ